MHINDDEILRLAEICSEYEDVNSDDLEKLYHIRDCDVCYDKFCAYLSLIDATSEVGIAYALEYGVDNNTTIMTDNTIEDSITMDKMTLHKGEEDDEIENNK